MGVLDDAIREHLDLKRRRGADPDEIERAEREALGPVRRAVEESDELDPDLKPGDAYEQGDAYDHQDDPGWDEEPYDERPEDPKSDVLAEPPPFMPSAPSGDTQLDEEAPAEVPRTETAQGPLTEPPLPDDEPFDDEPFDEEPLRQERDPVPEPGPNTTPPPAPAAPPREPEPRVAPDREPEPPQPGPETARPADHVSDETVEYDVEQAIEQGEQDDVLEETPEFLQDTPDHDRLWFEQRPPRDFDFDG